MTRIVTSAAYDVSANLIKNVSWPTIAEIIKAETSTMVFKSNNGLAPEYMCQTFSRNVRKRATYELPFSLYLDESYFVSFKKS